MDLLTDHITALGAVLHPAAPDAEHLFVRRIVAIAVTGDHLLCLRKLIPLLLGTASGDHSLLLGDMAQSMEAAHAD